MADSVDPDEMACYKPSHLDLLCLHRHWFWSAGLKELNQHLLIDKIHKNKIHSYNVLSANLSAVQEKDWCKLFCKADSSPSHFYMLNRKVIDGTKCRPDDNDICVDGQCRVSDFY